jgi:hypothetical protein
MTSGRCSTSHPFTIALCGRCSGAPATQLLQMLRASIRRCPHGMLVTTECLLGHLTCATRPPHEGVMLLLQPCSIQRTPTGPAQWMGPVNDIADARAVCDWLEEGHWQRHTLPDHQRAEANFARPSMRN